MHSPTREGVGGHGSSLETCETVGELGEPVPQQVELLELLWRHVERRHGWSCYWCVPKEDAGSGVAAW
jgi:hypothetical protein